MARVRPYKESDLAKLQELFHKNYPDLATPEFTNQDQLDLVLEDERGQVKMAIMGNSMVNISGSIFIHFLAKPANCRINDFKMLASACQLCNRILQPGYISHDSSACQ